MKPRRPALRGRSSPSAAQITADGASITELDAPALLSDADVKQFLVDGCLALPMTDLPVGFHRELQAKSRAGFEQLRADGYEDRYVYEQLHAMSDILSSPVLDLPLTPAPSLGSAET